MKLLSIILLLSTTAQAQVMHLDAGDKAPYEGFLFDLQQEKQLRLLDINLQACVSQSNVLSKALELQGELSNDYERSANLFRDQSQATAELALEAQGNSFWRSTLYFVLGATMATIIRGVASSK